MKSRLGLTLLLALSCGVPPDPRRPQPAGATTGAAAGTSAPAPPPSSEPSEQGAAPCERGRVVDLGEVEEPVTGSFSAPGRDEIAGELACDGLRSGPALLRRVGDHLQLERFEARADPRTSRRRCRALRAWTGRDLLLCLDEARAYGEHHQALVLVDYARDDEHLVEELVSVSDTTDASCAGDPSAVVAEIDGFEVTDLDHDGAPDVRVRVRAAKVRVLPRADCRMGTLGTGDPPRVPRPPLRTVELLLRGEALAPTPAGKRVLAALAALQR